SLGPELGDVMGGLVNEHAITRSVRDSARLLDASLGTALGDPYGAAPPLRPYAEEVRQAPGKLRVALSVRPPLGGELDAEMLAAIGRTATLLRELGHEVVEEEPPLANDTAFLMQAFTVVWAAGCAAAVQGLGMITGQTPGPDNLEPLTFALYQM